MCKAGSWCWSKKVRVGSSEFIMVGVWSLHNKMKVKHLSYLWLCLLLLGWGWLGCTRIENSPPTSSFEKGSGPLVSFDVRLDSMGAQTIRFDSIAQGGNFTLAFTPMAFGKIRIVEEGKAIQIQMTGHNWERDSTEYTICKNQTCRKGKIVVRNAQYEPPDTITPVDTSCSELPLRQIFLSFNTSQVIYNLFPFGSKGTIKSLQTAYYQATNQGDSAIIFSSIGIPVEQNWAWDTIHYQLKASNRKCWTGKLIITLGDTCEPHARSDEFSAPTGSILIPENELVANDRSCNNQLGSYQTRTPYEPPLDWDYGSYKKINTLKGVLTDTLVGGNQFYKYQKTSSSASEDGFYYYFKNLTTNRVTKAWVRIRF